MLNTSKIYDSNSFGQFKVLNYINCNSVEIQFLDTGHITTTYAGQIRSGAVKDKLAPSVYGVGFIGEGDHKPSVNGKDTKTYITWRDMLARCYSTKRQAAHPTYIGCTVVDEWHNFQNFANWFDENHIDGYALDKDMKVDGNKIYSPDTCKFIRQKDNTIKAHAKHYVVINPDGIKVSIYNMSEFCRENGLNQGAMVQVAKGKVTHHKQWTCERELT